MHGRRSSPISNGLDSWCAPRARVGCKRGAHASSLRPVYFAHNVTVIAAEPRHSSPFFLSLKPARELFEQIGAASLARHCRLVPARMALQISARGRTAAGRPRVAACLPGISRRSQRTLRHVSTDPSPRPRGLAAPCPPALDDPLGPTSLVALARGGNGRFAAGRARGPSTICVPEGSAS